MDRFSHDLCDAIDVERLVATAICKEFDLTFVKQGKNEKFDFILFTGKKELSFEVKHDKIASQSNRVAVEFECRGKPSGISVSCSDFYVIVIGSDAYIMNTTALKTLFESEKFTVTGGDPCSSTKMKLISLKTIKKYSKKITLKGENENSKRCSSE